MNQLDYLHPVRRSVFLPTLIFCTFPAFNMMPSLIWAAPATPATNTQEALVKQRQELEEELGRLTKRIEVIRAELKALEQTPAVVQPSAVQQTQARLQEEEIQTLSEISIVSTRIQKLPEGLSFSATPQSETESQPTRNMKEALESLPGVVLRQANGPRDFSISIRGSGVKTSFAIRDLKIYEDGFIQTQSDGLSRLDMHDPWFMRSVEVTRGAASSLYDNYALGGMVHFKTRRGSDINGAETFVSGGSYGYHKEAAAIGQRYKNLDVSLFASNVGEDGFIQHSNYKTQTLNFNFRFTIDDKQNFYFKAITNWLETRVPTRLTQAQFQADPQQAGTLTVARDQKRIDRRTIVGGMYERQIDDATVLTMEFDYDVKDINQFFFQIIDNVNPNYKHYTDLRHNGHLFDMPLRSYVGFFVNNMEQEGNSFTNLADGAGTRGTLVQNNRGTIRNIGGRFREELQFTPHWTLAAGLGFEQSQVSVQVINFSGGAVSSRASVNRTFYNWAPEMSLTWRPMDRYRNWIRGSTGYGIPGFSNLTSDPTTGLPGSNFNLQPQKNVNVEIGAEARVHPTLNVEVVGFWTFFRNEIITQNFAAAGTSASVNADSSEYRGVEVAYDWRPLPGWRFSGAYAHIDGRYINFSETLRVGAALTTFVHDGNKVGNVPTDVLNLKAAYDHAASGWGGWLEANSNNSYFLNNSNTVGIPAYWVLNANIHKDFAFTNSWVRFAKVYLELDNIVDKTYAASGNVVADSTADASKQLFFAGLGRAVYGGVTLGLF